MTFAHRLFIERRHTHDPLPAIDVCELLFPGVKTQDTKTALGRGGREQRDTSGFSDHW